MPAVLGGNDDIGLLKTDTGDAKTLTGDSLGEDEDTGDTLAEKKTETDTGDSRGR